ncbi:MAG: hypothetical protein QW207_04055, partial [Candidatus Micrarchaeaceae archaeon]
MLLLISFSNAQPTSIPSGIKNFTQLTLSSSWNVGHGAYVQQMINITESSFSNYIAYNTSFANFEYFYSNGTVIPGWIESNSSGKIITWVKIKNTTTTFYLGFAAKTTNLLSSSCTSGIGEAPQLSSTYAQYDTGPCVFPYYQRFGSLHALPSNWSEVPNTSVYFFEPYTYVQPEESVNGWYGIYLHPIPSSLSSTTTVWEFYANIYEVSAPDTDAGTSTGTTGNFNGYSFSESNSKIYLGNDNNEFLVSTGYNDTNIKKIYSMQMNSATSLSMLINYTSIYSTTSATPETPTYFSFSLNTSDGSYSNPIYIYWLRTRTLPPDGVMPSVSFGAVQVVPITLTITPNPAVYGQSIIITATCPSSSDSCAIAYPNLTTVIASGTGTATYTYSAGALGVGTYSSYYAEDKTTASNSTPQTLTISKATPTISLSTSPSSNYTYDGTGITATYNISTYHNQLTG